MVFEGTMGVYERIYRFNSKRVFSLRSNLSDDNIISAYKRGLRTGMDFRGLV